MRENGSYDGGALGRPFFDSGFAVGVSRETAGTQPFSGSSGLYETPGPDLRYGYTIAATPRRLEPGQPNPGPRAMADARPVSEPTSAMPVYEGSGGPNTIVSAAGHRGKAEMDSVRQSREPEDPPLAQEARRAVQILNPSGEIQMPRPPRKRVFCVSNQKGGVGKTTTS